MTRTSLHRVLRLGLGLGVLLASFGCAKENEPIVRVQPNALDKTFFVGELATPKDDPEFFWRGYVVDGSATQSQIGVGSWSHIDRIRWEITETQLIARKAYPLFNDPSAQGKFSGPDSVGSVVATYKISSHFDIKRAYNSSTGEDMNLIEENASDRPWNERQYMRVDWSSNVVDDPMWMDMFMGKAFGEIKVSPLVYNVTDPTSQDAPHFEAQDGYFDITNRFYLESAQTPLWGWSIPTCYLYSIFTSGATYECDPQEASVRFSFWKVDPNRDFEPLENTKAALDIVGNPGGLGDSLSVGVVTAPRMGFDPSYGFTDKNYHRLANIHNIWKKSHQAAACNAKGDADQNGTDDECENGVTGYGASTGSQCDIFSKKCTIPYRDREIKTVGYWVNDLMPAEFLDELDADGNPVNGRGAAEDIMFSWNQLFKASAAFAREVECRRTGEGDRGSCRANFFAPDKEMVSFGNWLIDKSLDETPVLTTCHNPVRKYDIKEVCGPEGYKARTGDIRRNMMVYWPYDSRAPWGGIANWNGDPLTGEIIGGMAMTMGRSVRYGAAFARDVLQVAMGDFTLQDVVEGVPVNQYFSPELAFKAQPKVGLSTDEIQGRVRAVDAKHAMESMGIKPLYGETMAEKMASFSSLKASQTYDPTSEAAAVSRFDSIVAPMIGSKMESQLTSPSWMRDTLGMDPNAPSSQGMMPIASPLQGMDPGKMKILRDTIRTRLEARGACFLNQDAPLIGSISIPGLATHFKNKYGAMSVKERGEAIYRELLPETFKGIELHEVGHSLGMLHQFSSSWDSPNFNPQYWQLRTNEGATTASCNGVARDASQPDNCMGPRYLDPPVADEMGMGSEPRPGIDYYASTSTMEYQWERFGETAGLGTYDLFTMNALYGRVLETFDDTRVPVAEQEKFGPRMRSQLNEHDMVMQNTKYGNFPQPLHYTELARQMQVFRPELDCRPATAEEKAIGKWRIVHDKVCAPTPKDHAAWQDFLSDATDPADATSQAPSWHTPRDARKGNGNVRWFYRWGSTNNSYMHTNPSDAGADPYEVAVNTRLKFEAMYPWAYFRRHNREYMDFFLPSSVASVYFERERSFHWHSATRSAQFMASFGADKYNEMAQSDDWLRPYLLAGVESFNMLYRAVVMPQPGTYYDAPERRINGWQKSPTTDTVDYPGPMDPILFEIPMGYGRFIDLDIDSSPTGGGSWNYSYWVRRAGFETEKAYAMANITDGRPPVYSPSRELFLDPRIQSASFYADMPQAVDRLLAGMLANDWETIGMQGVPDAMPKLYDITQPVVPARDANSHVVFPNMGYDQQSYSAILAALYSRETGDMTLLNKMRVWVEGVDGDIGGAGFPDLTQQQRFFNPLSGFTYVSRKFGPEQLAGKTVEKGIGARMLQYGNWILSKTYKVKVTGQFPDFDEFGGVIFLLDAQGQPQLQSKNSYAQVDQLIKFVGMIDAMRQIGLYLGGGPL